MVQPQRDNVLETAVGISGQNIGKAGLRKHLRQRKWLCGLIGFNPLMRGPVKLIHFGINLPDTRRMITKGFWVVPGQAFSISRQSPFQVNDTVTRHLCIACFRDLYSIDS